MRKFFVTLLLLLVLTGVVGALWLLEGKKISTLVDGYRIAETTSEQVHSVRYEGTGSGGVLSANDVSLSLNEAVAPVSAPTVGSTKDGKLGLASGGNVFPLGQLTKESEESTDRLSATPDSGDDGRVVLGHSLLSWPTPFGVNFMTGYTPSWKRHTYQKLTWTKPNGMKLEMLWRYEQFYDKVNGWASPTMTREGETGLIKVDITP
jgi:hypothetical protein